jgi:hypothetical protein
MSVGQQVEFQGYAITGASRARALSTGAGR